MSNTQLLCTFCTLDTLQETIGRIQSLYTITFNTIYVLENTALPEQLCLTYNVEFQDKLIEVPESTISLHRKKATNTLYTINALNKLIAEENGGKLDKTKKLDWPSYRNCILITAYGKLKRIDTQLKEIVRLDK